MLNVTNSNAPRALLGRITSAKNVKMGFIYFKERAKNPAHPIITPLMKFAYLALIQIARFVTKSTFSAYFAKKGTFGKTTNARLIHFAQI